MTVEAVVALIVDRLAELLSKDARLLGLHGEINRIQEELNQMRPFLKDADIKQKEVVAVRDWMADIRDVCFDVDDVIDILGQGQAAQGRHGFVERLKRCISDQITRYKVGKEIERIKLSIKGIKRSRESYGITEINEERPEAASSTQCLQEGSGCSVPPVEVKILIDEGRQGASSLSQNLQAHRRIFTLPGEPEEEEINRVGQRFIEEEPRLWDGTRDISERKLEESSSTPGKANRVFSTLLGDSGDVGLQEGIDTVSEGESEEVGLQEEIDTVSEQSIKEEPGPYDSTRYIDEGRFEASSLAPLQEEIDTVSGQLINEEPSPCDGTRVIDEGPECRDGSTASTNRKMPLNLSIMGPGFPVTNQEVPRGGEMSNPLKYPGSTSERSSVRIPRKRGFAQIFRIKASNPLKYPARTDERSSVRIPPKR